MRKNLIKLSAAAILVVIALVVTVVSTFAWYTVSGAPEMGGLQLNIGGSGTIQLAADIAVKTENGVLHYPGAFSDSLNFSRYTSYDYLQEIVGLSPVSTADGIHWFFPTYYGAEGGEHAGLQGSLQEMSDFLMDDTYTAANLTELPDDDSLSGCYAMMDFWVVAPMDCSLRVSYGDADSGSYAVTLPIPSKNAEGKYEMKTPDASLAAAVRVGFLADGRKVVDDSMRAYMDSRNFRNSVRSLRGVYGEPGESWDGFESQFTIYEPNGSYHSGDDAYTHGQNGLNHVVCEDGSYIKTMPVGYVDGQAKLVDVTDRTAVQTATSWLPQGESLLIQQLFETFMLGESEDTDPALLFQKFCSQYLGYQCDAYIEKGEFVRSVRDLLNACDSSGVVSPDSFDTLTTGNVTEDVIVVDLQQNIPQRIRMFVWIEGQDVDCSNVMEETGLMIHLELAGASN